MTAETTLRIAKECRNIVAVKEASGNFSQIMQILKNRPDDFLVLSGDDSITLPMLALGADGVISVAVQSAPKVFCEMVHEAMHGDFQVALKKHYQLLDLMEALFLDGNPAGVKAALNALKLCENELRLPLVPVNSKIELLIKQLVTLNN
jgi:4-hydroxy-tetrahydrodipicolinate synthase